MSQQPTPIAPPSPSPIALSRWIEPSAFLTLVRMTVERLARGRRLLVLSIVFMVPTAIALLARAYPDDGAYHAAEAEETLIFYMVPQSLLPLTALVFASGMIQDEIEDQTLTYLLVRPLPRWALYLAKLVGTVLVAALVTAVFTTLALVAIYWGGPEFRETALLKRVLVASGLFGLATFVYASIFGCLSLVLRRVLVIGVAYVILFEGLFANIDFVVRKGTVMWYLRVLGVRWLGLDVPSWSIDLDLAPSGLTSLLVLLGIALTAIAIACVLMCVREFRVKTPEGA